MAPRTTPDLAPEADAGTGPQSPAELLELLRCGLTFAGVRVLTLRVELEDGTTQRLQMPAPRRSGKAWAKTATGRKILDVLSREGRALKGATIAKLADLEYSGSFRQTIKGLAGAGEIDHDPEEQVYGLAE